LEEARMEASSSRALVLGGKRGVRRRVYEEQRRGDELGRARFTVAVRKLF